MRGLSMKVSMIQILVSLTHYEKLIIQEDWEAKAYIYLYQLFFTV